MPQKATNLCLFLVRNVYNYPKMQAIFQKSFPTVANTLFWSRFAIRWYSDIYCFEMRFQTRNAQKTIP